MDLDFDLKYALENGILDTTLVRQEVEMKKRKEYLEMNPYEIWQGKDGKWNVYLPGATPKDRKRKTKKTKREIENVVIEFWREQDENPTINEVFSEWLEGKFEREEILVQTYERYKREWEKSFKDNFGRRRIQNVTEWDIEKTLLNLIHDKKLTQKRFNNVRTLIYGTFRIAKKKRYIDYSITEVMKDAEISRKAFKKIHHEDEELVFMDDELPVILRYLEENLDIVNCGILLLFKTGMRVGELTALSKEDIVDDVIKVHKTEIHYTTNHKVVYEIQDFTKTDAGIRNVVLAEGDEWILKAIRDRCPFGEWVFMRDGERIKSTVFRDRLKYICKKLGIVSKSPHKIRKTYGSILLDSGVPESVIISQMGHTNIDTTKKYYYRNRHGIDARKEALKNVMDF